MAGAGREGNCQRPSPAGPASRIVAPRARSLPARRMDPPARRPHGQDRRGQRAGGVAAARTGRFSRAVEGRRQLDGHDGVGARRDRRAGRDPDRGAARDLDGRGRFRRAISPMTSRSDGRVLARRRHVGSPDGVPVHRRVVPGRQRGRADRPAQRGRGRGRRAGRRPRLGRSRDGRENGGRASSTEMRPAGAEAALTASRHAGPPGRGGRSRPSAG